MQVLAESGDEFGVHEGLGWIPGSVRRFRDHGLPVPHSGMERGKRDDMRAGLLGEHQTLDFYFRA